MLVRRPPPQVQLQTLTNIWTKCEGVGPFDGEDAGADERCQGRREDRRTLNAKRDDSSEGHSNVAEDKI